MDKLQDSVNLVNGAAILLAFFAGYRYGSSNGNEDDSNNSVSPTSTKPLPNWKRLNKTKLHNKNASTNRSNPKDIVKPGQYKMVFVVRTDLKMSKGKIAAQCGHAAIAAYKKARQDTPQILSSWENRGCAKIVVKIEGLEPLRDIKRTADHMNITNAIIVDAGLTQIEPNTMTVVAVGPAHMDDIASITNHLRLL